MPPQFWAAILIVSGASVLTWFMTVSIIALTSRQTDSLFLYAALIPALAVAMLVGGLLLWRSSSIPK